MIEILKNIKSKISNFFKMFVFYSLIFLMFVGYFSLIFMPNIIKAITFKDYRCAFVECRLEK